MSVMMGFGGQGPPGGTTSGAGELLYAAPGCGLSPHPLTPHDSGIDMSPSDSLLQELPPTQEIEYHDATSSSSDSRASFSDTVSDYTDGGAIASGGRGSGPLVVDKPSTTRSRRRRRSPPKATFDFNDNSLVSVYTFFKTFLGASTASTVAIDNKIEQAMDLVKSHLMFAVREEVDVLKERIVELMDRIKHLECENSVLRQYASPEVLQQLQTQMSHQQMQQPPHHSSTS